VALEALRQKIVQPTHSCQSSSSSSQTRRHRIDRYRRTDRRTDYMMVPTGLADHTVYSITDLRSVTTIEMN